MSARVEYLTVVGAPEVWSSMGLIVGDDGAISLRGTSVRILSPSADVAAPMSWSLSGLDGPDDIDGLATSSVDVQPPRFADHALGAVGLDHVVVITPDLERTSAAIAASTGCELRRVREIGSMRQGFHRIGPGGLIVELVERPDVPDGPASFWGFVIDVADIDAACALIGADRVSAPKDAVQPGRRIATIRPEAGLGVAVALMSAP